ncbi:MAG: hypothetical protein JNK01_24920 [Devosia sp.]|nr:hypothetical protein [Devosia sp.]
MPTTLPNLCALLGCLAGYVLAGLIAAAAPLDVPAAALVTAFLPSVIGLAAYGVGRQLDT